MAITQRKSQFQIIDFGQLHGGTSIDIRKRPAKGAGLMLINNAIPANSFIQFDNTDLQFPVVPNSPIFFNFNQTISLHLAPSINSSLISSLDIDDASFVKFITFENKEDFFENLNSFEVRQTSTVDHAGLTQANTYIERLYNFTDDGIRQIINDHLGAKKIKIQIGRAASALTICFQVYDYVTIDRENNLYADDMLRVHGYLVSKQGSDFDYDDILINNQNLAIAIERVFNTVSNVDIRFRIDFLS